MQSQDPSAVDKYWHKSWGPCGYFCLVQGTLWQSILFSGVIPRNQEQVDPHFDQAVKEVITHGLKG